MDDAQPWQSLAEKCGVASAPRSDAMPFSALPELLLNRRQFLKLTGGTVALGALAACSGPPQEQIVPWVKAPPEYTPGKPLYYATALPYQGYARGVLVECHEARPTKIEGNPLHPASLGATDPTTQAEIRTLWDANRSRTPLRDGQPASWELFVSELIERRLRHQRDGGAGLRILAEPTTSPSLIAQLSALQRTFPASRTHFYSPVDDRNALVGARMAFGQAVDVRARLEKADLIVTFDCDFLGDHMDAVRLAAEFAKRRDPEINGNTMNRLYAVECTPSLTGAMADQRLALRSSAIQGAAAALAAELGISRRTAGTTVHSMGRLARELKANRGRSLILAGTRQPPAVHALAHAMNAHLGNVGETVDYLAPVRTPADDLGTLFEEMARGTVQTLLILGANPVYTAPVDADFAALLKRVPFSVHLGLYQDETALACHWTVPQAHVLETWGDLRATDGTATLCQPMIAPLFGGKSERELLAILNGDPNPSVYRLVRDYWQKIWGGAPRIDAQRPPRDRDAEHIQSPTDPFTQRWQRALQDGVIAGSAAPVQRVVLVARDFGPPSDPGEGIELNLLPDPTIGDGRHAGNPWLQELPKPLTKLTWDNALLVAPGTAERLGLTHEGFAELRVRGQMVRAPVWITPGHATDALTLHLGYGRSAGSPVALNHGVNGYRLRHRDGLDFISGVSVVPVEGRYSFADGQLHDRLEGRNLLRFATLTRYLGQPDFARDRGEDAQGGGLYPPFPYTGYKWAMSIDLNTCTGCSACVVACQAENNIPSVGKEEIRRGRKMHWLRVDRYYVGEPDAPRIHFQPVPCMQCENAPCEPVCPVGASIHDDEGINVQVYNRCIGTRFCSNNCPYKVRRFNFFEFAQDETVSNHQRNPDVTVRMRGIMEKCNYCLQRIAQGRIAAELEERPLRDGEVVTACQAACPTRAIVFGNLNDPASAVNGRKALPRNYTLLAELNTHPRTTYLAKLTNPSIEEESPAEEKP